MQPRVAQYFEFDSIEQILSLVTEEEFVSFFRDEYRDCWDGQEELGFNIRSKQDLINNFWDLDIQEGDIVDSILSLKDGLWVATWADMRDGVWIIMKLELPKHLDPNNIIFYSNRYK